MASRRPAPQLWSTQDERTVVDEAFEYLLSTHQIDGGDIRELLWRYKDKGGFEEALGDLQSEAEKHPRSEAADQNRTRLESAIQQMFGDMNKHFASLDFEYKIYTFLTKFDAIFTLNQDLLLDHQYLKRDDIGIHLYPKRTGAYMPGMQPLPDGSGRWSAMQEPFMLNEKLQPYIKLHGSSDWIDLSKGKQLLVMGGNKAATIDRYPILRWNHEQFKMALSKPETRLMVVGYSFRDEHINNAIWSSSRCWLAEAVHYRSRWR